MCGSELMDTAGNYVTVQAQGVDDYGIYIVMLMRGWGPEASTTKFILQRTLNDQFCMKFK